MSFGVVGIDFKSLNINKREKFAFLDDEIKTYLINLKNNLFLDGVLILSTCNRVEIYFENKNFDLEKKTFEIIGLWLKNKNLDVFNEKIFYKIYEENAIKHLMEVSCGLKSLAFGEAQILGQIKKSYFLALAQKTLSKKMNRVFQNTFAVSKIVRFQTDIGQCPVSVAFSAVNLAKNNLEDLHKKSVLILGAGQTSKLIAQHILNCKPKRIFILNRTVERAKNLSQLINRTNNINKINQDISYYDSLKNVNNYLHKVDIIVSAIIKDSYIIDFSNIEFIKNNLFLIDLSVPMSINPKLNNLPNINLYSIDDINNIVSGNLSHRKKFFEQAKKIIENHLNSFLLKEKCIEQNQSIIKIKTNIEDIINKEYELILHKINNNNLDKIQLKKELDIFCHRIKNKILHKPYIFLNSSIKNDNSNDIDIIKNLFK